MSQARCEMYRPSGRYLATTGDGQHFLSSLGEDAHKHEETNVNHE